MDCGDPDEFHGEFNSDDHERLEGEREWLFDTELRKNFMKAKEKAEEAEMSAWVAVARKQSLLGCRACGDVG